MFKAKVQLKVGAMDIRSLMAHPHFTHNIRRQYPQYFSAFYHFEDPHFRKSAFYRRSVRSGQCFAECGCVDRYHKFVVLQLS